jgi:two-component system, sensor histidine kinase and response regulator
MASELANILVIDDEPGIREGCRRALVAQGHTVYLAENSEAGLRQLAEIPADLVLLDIMMPGMDGMEALERIRASDPEIVVIIITGYATVELAIQAIKQGAYDFLSKPFDAVTLQLAVAQGLERRRLSIESQRVREMEAEAERLEREKADLARLNQLKSTFTLLVAHELRAPVAAIQSYLKLILEGYIGEDRFHEIIGKAERRAGEQLALIGDLLDLARISDGVQRVDDLVPVDLVAVLLEVRDMMQAHADEKAITLHVDIGEAIPLILANPKHVRQLWTNLVSNAVKYTESGGRATARLHLVEGEVRGSVEDTGIGIAEEDLPRIFEDFFRTQQAKEFERMGTGLGLSIVRAILDLYQGEISVESELGVGSTFSFRIPLPEPGLEAA